MTISLTGVTVDTGVPAQQPRAAINPVISTAGNDNQQVARQQLASAVPAPALLAAYSTGIAPQPKLPAKPLSSAPSSSFAAQFIGQDAGSNDDLALFEPPPATANTTEEESPADDYLNDLRIARGDFSAVNKSAPTEARDAADKVQAAQIAKPAAAQASEAMEHSNLLSSVLSHPGRRATVSQVKGVGAYQLAQARNGQARFAKTAVAEAAN